jgi:hypothetical protein
MGPLEIHIQRLRQRRAEAEFSVVEGSGTRVSLPSIALPPGWSKASTAIHFFAPQGYPFAKPDCFWADEDLRLASGAVPHASNCTTPMPGLGKPALWFSWHTEHWNASRDDLMTWIAAIAERLARPV